MAELREAQSRYSSRDVASSRMPGHPTRRYMVEYEVLRLGPCPWKGAESWSRRVNEQCSTPQCIALPQLDAAGAFVEHRNPIDELGGLTPMQSWDEEPTQPGHPVGDVVAAAPRARQPSC